MRKHKKVVPNLSAVQIEGFNQVYAIRVPAGEVVVLISPGKMPIILDKPPQPETALLKIGIACDDNDEPEVPIYAVTVTPEVAEEMRSRFISVDYVAEFDDAVDEDGIQVHH